MHSRARPSVQAQRPWSKIGDQKRSASSRRSFFSPLRTDHSARRDLWDDETHEAYREDSRRNEPAGRKVASGGFHRTAPPGAPGKLSQAPDSSWDTASKFVTKASPRRKAYNGGANPRQSKPRCATTTFSKPSAARL